MMRQESEVRTTETGGLIQADQDKTAGTGKSGYYSQHRREMTGRPEHDSKDRSAGKGQPGQENLSRTSMTVQGTGHPGPDI
jgi:hypothetical protein